MATNVTEKDKTLNEIIDWCEQMEADGLRLASALLIQHDMPHTVSCRDKSEQTENSKQDTGREINTSEHSFIRLQSNKSVEMICDAYQNSVFSGKEQS